MTEAKNKDFLKLIPRSLRRIHEEALGAYVRHLAGKTSARAVCDALTAAEDELETRFGERGEWRWRRKRVQGIRRELEMAVFK